MFDVVADKFNRRGKRVETFWKLGPISLHRGDVENILYYYTYDFNSAPDLPFVRLLEGVGKFAEAAGTQDEVEDVTVKRGRT